MFAFRMKFLSNMFLFTIIFIVNYWFLGNGWRQAGDSTWHKPALTPFTAGICFMFFPWRPYCLRDQVTRPWYWLGHTDRFRFFSCWLVGNRGRTFIHCIKAKYKCRPQLGTVANKSQYCKVFLMYEYHQFISHEVLWYGNVFCITGPLWGECTGHTQKANNAKLCCLFFLLGWPSCWTTRRWEIIAYVISQ